ncbi:MAG: hypothetical protein Q9183_005895, partial [Haloplaca sp. 2 TL-2023]
MAPQPDHLDPSELGTKDYWDTTYTADLANDTAGTTWFADSNASSRTLSYLLSLRDPLSPEKTSFLDLGTGNGEMLFLLRSQGGFAGPMLGLDYSAASVELASKIASEQGLNTGHKQVRFREWDILGGDWVEAGEGRFDVVLDKGTFDAISLNSETDADGKRLCEGYRAKVMQMVVLGGTFLVTSCNWTEEELRSWFEQNDDAGEGGLQWIGNVQYPKFSFGGITGQS